jgi:exodeoxyribonuclease VII large subunit
VAETVALTVSAALHIAKESLHSIPLHIVGEISGFRPHTTYSAFYFQLKDERSVMNVTLWRNVYEKFDLELRDGMIVEMNGHFDVYAAKGSMSFIPHHFKIAGEGDLRAQVAALAEKLRSEGLMEDALKKTLPFLPERIGVITSPNGAAVHDVIRTLGRRYPLAEVLFFGTLVEGHEATHGVVRALAAADESDADVILLVRGGGSFEDLLPFSDEAVARAIAAVRTPVVTGIGHEPDFSIADMVADLRASTPTAAAEAVVPARDELHAILAGYLQRMALPLEGDTLRLDSLRQRLEQTVAGHLEGHLMRIDAFQQRLEQAIPRRLERDTYALATYTQRLTGIGSRLIEKPTTLLSKRAAQLEALSPLKVLARGYAAVFDTTTHAVIDSIEKVTIGEELTVQLADGSLGTKVERIHERMDA